MKTYKITYLEFNYEDILKLIEKHITLDNLDDVLKEHTIEITGYNKVKEILLSPEEGILKIKIATKTEPLIPQEMLNATTKRVEETYTCR